MRQTPASDKRRPEAGRRVSKRDFPHFSLESDFLSGDSQECVQSLHFVFWLTNPSPELMVGPQKAAVWLRSIWTRSSSQNRDRPAQPRFSASKFRNTANVLLSPETTIATENETLKKRIQIKKSEEIRPVQVWNLAKRWCLFDTNLLQ